MKNKIKNAYLPYKQEFTRCLIIDAILILVSFLIFAVIGIEKYLPILGLIALHIAAECFTNYKVGLLMILEKGKTETSKLKLSEIKEEMIFSAPWYMDILYIPLNNEKLYLKRFSVICFSRDGKRIRLRTVMGNEKRLKFANALQNNEDNYISVTYGKYSKIILTFNKQSDNNDFYNIDICDYVK